MVTGYDHQRLKNNLLVITSLYLCKYIIHRRSCLNGTYKIVLKTCICQLILHLLIYSVAVCLCTMSHEADGCLTIIILSCCICDSLHNLIEILITCKKRITDYNLIKCICIIANFIYNICILQTIHQMCRLDYKILNAVIHCTVKGFCHIINGNAISSLYMINDDLACKASSD